MRTDRRRVFASLLVDASSGSYLGLPWQVRDVSRPGYLSWTRANSSHGSLSKQLATMGSIRGLTGSRKFETCPDWGATTSISNYGPNRRNGPLPATAAQH